MRLYSLAMLLVAWLVPLGSLCADDTPPERMADVSLDRADQNAMWRLSDHVLTSDGPPPAIPGAVYLQFGFIGCEPCERLADVANTTLGDRVTRVYVHLDDVLMGSGSRPRQIWKQLYAVSQAPPYSDFITLRRGSTLLMQSLCGEDAGVPSALLIRPDGTLHAVLNTPDEDAARTHMTAFLQNLPQDADPKETP